MRVTTFLQDVVYHMDAAPHRPSPHTSDQSDWAMPIPNIALNCIHNPFILKISPIGEILLNIKYT